MIAPATPLILIGCGNMGRALAEGWCASLLAANALLIIDPKTTTAPNAPFPLSGYPTLAALPDDITPSAICLATKPDQLAATLNDIRTRFSHAAPLVFSVAAGKTLSFYQSHLWADAKIIRIMPNTPAMIGEGMSVCIGTPNISRDDMHEIDRLMATVGDVLWIEDEAQMDAVTALSGSGPAYLFYFLECLIEAGIKLGLSEMQATRLAKQTMLGASRLAKAEVTPISQLRDNVTSPNGTTYAAMKVFVEAGSSDFKSIIENALKAAHDRSIELRS